MAERVNGYTFDCLRRAAGQPRVGLFPFRLAGLIAAVTLSACVNTTPSPPPADAAKLAEQVAQSDVGPGPDQVDGIGASIIFRDVCVATAPSFRKAPAVMAKMPFRQHPGTGTYYHRNLDLSIKLMPKRCSMVFTSKDDPSRIGIMVAISPAWFDQESGSVQVAGETGKMASVTNGGAKVEFEPLGRRNSRNWYRAVIIAP